MKNKLLIASGILLILSLLTVNPLILTICLSLFVFMVNINCLDLFKGRKIIKTNMIPVLFLGIIFVAISIATMWGMVLF